MTPKVPPYSDETERNVLGCMLIDRDSVITVLNMLGEDDFYIEQNKLVFRAIRELYQSDYEVDSVTVYDKLRAGGHLERIGASYVAELSEIVPYTKNIEQYARIVYEKAMLRQMIVGFSNLISSCYEEQMLADILEEAERFIYNLSMSEQKRDFVALKEAIKVALVTLGELYASNNAITGCPTGFRAIDSLTKGLQPSDLIVLAARPSMGKTALGLNIAQNAAFRHKKIVAFFSLEMSCEQLVMRIISSETEINASKIKVGTQPGEEWSKVTHLNSDIQTRNVELYIDDTSGITVGDIRSKLRKLKAQIGLDLVVIDYLQLMTVRGKIDNRQQEISQISRELKGIAKELNVPVIALSQLSRNPEGRKDRRPILSDLRESGAIEQDADIVMMLYRENYYERETENNETEVIFAKHRNGEVGTVKLKFLSQFTKFEDVDQSINDMIGEIL